MVLSDLGENKAIKGNRMGVEGVPEITTSSNPPFQNLISSLDLTP